MARNFAFIAIFGLFLYVVSPLLLPVAMGALFATLFYPAQMALERRKVGPALAASLVTLGVTLLIVLPGALVTVMGVKAGVKFFKGLRLNPDSVPGGGLSLTDALIQQPFIERMLGFLDRWFHLSPGDVFDSARDVGQSVALWAGEATTKLLAQVPSLSLGVSILVVSLFFFLLDGRRALAVVREASMFSREETEAFIHSIGAMCRAVILATVISGFGQALLFGVVAAICQVPNWALIALLVFLASFIPLIGAAPVTFGIALHQGLTHGPGWGLTLAIAAFSATLVDNFVRPLVLKGEANLHPLLAFVAAFGGLQVFGFSGVFLGPVVAGVAGVALRHAIAHRKAMRLS